MTLRGKLLIAQAPLALAIIALGGVAASSINTLTAKTELVLRDNYRSVLAAERMKEADERIDSGAAMILLGDVDGGKKQLADSAARFEAQLVVEEHNLTEPGEPEAATALRAAWTKYHADLDTFLAGPANGFYFGTLVPDFVQVKDGVDRVLDINQDAIVRKSDAAVASATRASTVLLLVAVAALLAGLLGSVTLTARVIRPLSVLGQAVRRLGAGDLAARAQVAGRADDEIAGLAREFNTMAGHLAQYRKSSLGELLAAQNAAQAVIDSLPDPVVVVGLEGDLLNVNAAAEETLGLKLESGLTGLDPTVRALVDRVAAHVLGGHGPYTPRGMDESIRSGALQLLPRGAPVYSDEGVIEGATVVLQDVTRLLRFDELKTNLVATVAHEFRTPLTSLRMAIHMCLEGAAGALNDKQAELLHVGREDCERLQSIVDDLLDMSRIQAGRVDLAPRGVAAEALVREAVDAHQAAARHANLELRADVAPGLAVVMADPDRTELVFANLIGNAIRHTSEGSITVRALTGATPGQVRFEVVDTGSGIPVEHQASIFEKFFRVPGTPGGGAGLGLYIVKEIVEAQGGTLGVVSAPGQGTTFWFELPEAGAVGGGS